MTFPPRFNPPLVDHYAKAVELFIATGRLNAIMLNRQLGVTIPVARDIIRRMGERLNDNKPSSPPKSV